MQAVQIPRSKLKTAESRGEVQRVGVYFLFGETEEEAGKSLAYIGKAENCYQRIIEHHRNKDFWNTAVAVTSKTLSFTKAHARYLEYDCIRKARAADRFRLENDQTPAELHIPEPMLAELTRMRQRIKTIISQLLAASTPKKCGRWIGGYEKLRVIRWQCFCAGVKSCRLSASPN